MEYLHVNCPLGMVNEAKRELQKCKSKCDELMVNWERI